MWLLGDCFSVSSICVFCPVWWMPAGLSFVKWWLTNQALFLWEGLEWLRKLQILLSFGSLTIATLSANSFKTIQLLLPLFFCGGNQKLLRDWITHLYSGKYGTQGLHLVSELISSSPRTDIFVYDLKSVLCQLVGFPGGKEPTCQCWSLKRCRFDPLVRKTPMEMCMAIHSSILAWKIPWTEEPGRLQSIGSHKSWTWLKWLSMHMHAN